MCIIIQNLMLTPSLTLPISLSISLLLLFSFFTFSGCQTTNRSKTDNADLSNVPISSPTPSVSIAPNSNSKETVDKELLNENKFEGTVGLTKKSGENIGVVILKDVRAARHEGFNRVVFEFEGKTIPDYEIEYIDKPVRRCGSGDVTPIAGDGWLQVRLTPSQAHTDKGEATIKNREQILNLNIIREMELTCDFEADVTWVLGVSSPNRYRVLELKEPTRLVVDIRD
jgi:hypothetical protein